jgi:hypothetical protein
MREWRKEVERRLRGAGLDGGTERDIVDELAAHLQDRYDELRAQGLPETRRVRRRSPSSVTTTPSPGSSAGR